MLKNYVDIILPVYNSKKFIISTLESVVSQSYQCWKLIIIDDKSSDGTSVLLKNFYKKSKFKNRILILRNKKNKGQGYCRNIGLKHSKSEFVAFIDSDDIWMKKKLEKQIQFMKDLNYSFTYTDYKIFSENKNKIIYVPASLNYSQFVLNTSICTSTMIIRNQVINNYFPFKIRLCEDYFFKCQLIKKLNAYKCPGVYTKYLVRKNSLQSSRIKVLLAVWGINRNLNKMNVFQNLLSIIFISFNSLIKYGTR
jgi:teichuronic acid biosynthesis glycosyltransferase TuaG